MSDVSYKGTPEWMKHVVVFMPDDVMIAGKYTGYQSVETGETIWSRFVDRERHERQDRCEGISIIYIHSDQFYSKEECDADHGYFSMQMWRDGYLWNPCCYHRDCWEAVGKPMGFRGASLRSQDQGFGQMAKLYAPSNYDNPYDDDLDDGPYIDPPTPGPEAMQLWAVNSICHFFILVSSWARACEHAEEQRDLWRRIGEMEELVKRTDALIEEYDDEKDSGDSGSGLRSD